MNPFDYSRHAKEANPYRLYSSPGYSSNYRQSFVYDSLVGLKGSNYLDQKERMLMNQQLYNDIGLGISYQPPQIWNENAGESYDLKKLNLKHSKSDIKIPREQQGLDDYGRFQPPEFDQYPKQFLRAPPRNLPMHSNMPSNHNIDGIYKPPTIVSEFSAKFPMDHFGQAQIPTELMGLSTISYADDANGYRGNGPSQDFYMESQHNFNGYNLKEIGPKYPIQQNEPYAQKNYTGMAPSTGFIQGGRNAIPRVPKDIFHTGAKMRAIV